MASDLAQCQTERNRLLIAAGSDIQRAPYVPYVPPVPPYVPPYPGNEMAT